MWKILKYRQEHPLAYRLLFYILLCSSFFAILATFSQLYVDYHKSVRLIEKRIQQIEDSYLGSLSKNLWDFDHDALDTQLRGILQLPDIVYVSLYDTSQALSFSRGTLPSRQSLSRQYPLQYNHKRIGIFYVAATLESVYQRLQERVLLILVTQLIKSFVVSLFILFIFQYLVTRHLNTMAQYAQQFELSRLSIPLRLHRRFSSKEPDELDRVVHAMNQMRLSLLQDIRERERIEMKLKQLNEDLERRVAERTLKLEQSLQTLRQTQDHLIQQEKLAALGSLVAGIAHEINTPLGVGLTAASHLDAQTQDLISRHEAHTLTRSDFEHYLTTARESSRIILANLWRAAELIKSFKQVAVDQSAGEKREFALKEYLQDILISLAPELKRTRHQITMECPDKLRIYSYPGVFSQILSNFVMNSLIHGFRETASGHITIIIAVHHNALYLTYSDNGVGITPENQRKIFNPFFTTNRNKDSSGLGMYIVHNLVTQKLGGTIECQSQRGKGTSFAIEIPLNLLSRHQEVE